MAQLGSTPVAHMQVGPVSVTAKTWHFVRHFIEMCLAMCVGLAVLDTVYVWLAGQFGVANPYLRFPELSAAVVAFNNSASSRPSTCKPCCRSSVRSGTISVSAATASQPANIA